MDSWSAVAGVGEEEDGVEEARRRAEAPWSRIFWTCAVRLGFVGRGGGGVCEGRGTRARCRVVSWVRSGEREGRGEVMALVVGSRVRGRRVKVWSIVDCWEVVEVEVEVVELNWPGEMGVEWRLRLS